MESKLVRTELDQLDLEGKDRLIDKTRIEDWQNSGKACIPLKREVRGARDNSRHLAK